MNELIAYGWTTDRAAELDDSSGEPARITSEHRGEYNIITADGEHAAELSGKMRHAATGREHLPTVGDWVQVVANPGGLAKVRRILPRTTVLVRKEAGTTTTAQAIAANVDCVFIVSSLNRDFNPRRLERACVLVEQSGAQPVIILTKSDLCDEPETLLEQAVAAAPRATVHCISSLTGEGIDALAPYLAPASTIALLGTSGVGKSTLVNRLAGTELMAVSAARDGDDRGRHTTRHRQLLRLPSGALLVDTPGMRELGLWVAGGDASHGFDDIAALAATCRFRDCGHGAEPGCAVRAAIETDELDPERLASHRKLLQEQAWIERRLDQRKSLAEKKKWKAVTKSMRGFSKRGE